MDLVKPRHLVEGDTFRIVAPSSGMDALDKTAVKRGIDNLERLGLRVEISPHASRRHGHASGTPQERAEDLMDAFTDPDVDAIMAVWGGWNSNDVIGYLDYSEIRGNAKVFIGYSDTTVLNVAFLEWAGLVSFQGPAFVTFTHPHLMGWEVEEFKRMIMSTTAPNEIHPTPTYIDDPYYFLHTDRPPQEVANPGWKIHRGGTAKGRLIGGHLGTLLTLAGTPFWPDFRRKILFIEEDEEGGPTGNIARKFRHLVQTGALDHIEAIMIGRIPSAAGLKENDSLEMILDETLEGYGLPVVSGVDFGHTNPMATIPVGVRARLEADAGKLVFLESGTK
jgi:muramoyltetrapeptide carboxypeptidase